MSSLIKRPRRMFEIKHVERPDNVPALIDYEAIRLLKEKENFNKITTKPKVSARKEKERKVITLKDLTKLKLLDNKKINQNARDLASYYFSKEPSISNIVKGTYWWLKGNVFNAPETGNPYMNTGTPPIISNAPMNLFTLATSAIGGEVGEDLGEKYLGGDSGKTVGRLLGTIGGGGLGYNGTKFWNWGNTEHIVKGTEATTRYKHFSPYVEKVVYDPKYLELKNSIPAKRLLKSKLIRYEDGYPVYRLLKVIPSKKINNEFIRGLVKDKIYPTKIKGDSNILGYSPEHKLFIGDFEENLGVFPWNPFRQYAFDWSALTPKELLFVSLKNGGTIWMM